MASIPIVTTPRLRLVAPSLTHFEAFAREQKNPAITQHIRDGKPQDRTAAFNTLCVMLGHWELRGYGMWMVEEHDGTFAGRVGYINMEGYVAPEFGWQITSALHGRGYATEASRAALDYGRRAWKLDGLICHIKPDNAPSIAVAKKLGCALEGVHEEADGPLQRWTFPPFAGS